MKISQKLILSYVLIGLMIGGVGFVTINFTKDALIKLEGQESINVSNEIRATLLNELEYRMVESKELAHHKIVLDEIKKSNSFFDSQSDPELLIESRESQWRNNFSEEINFMFYISNNQASELLLQKLNFYKNEFDSEIFAEIFITNAYGVNVAQTGQTSDYIQNDETWWKESKQNSLHISDIDFDESSGVYSIDISQKITDSSGNFLGVTKAVLNTDELFQLLENSKRTSHSNIEIYLVDEQNNILFTTSKNPFMKSELGNSNIDGYGLIENESRFISISDSQTDDFKDNLGLNIIVEHNPKDIFTDIDSLIWIIGFILLLVTVTAIGAGLLIARSIGIPLKILSNSSDKLANGILDESVNVYSDDELGELGKKFEHMRLKLKLKNEDLKSELKIRAKRLSDYKNAIDKHALVSITDKKGNIIYVNEKFCDVSKYNAEEIGRAHV